MKNVCRNGQLDVFKFFVNCLEENVLEKNVLYLLDYALVFEQHDIANFLKMKFKDLI